MTDGKLRKVESVSELKPGMVLRPLDTNGYVSPFSDVVVTKVYKHADSMWFDVVRPYAFAHYGGELHSVEKVGMLSARSLGRYHLVLLASGKPYTCIVGE